MNPAIEAEVVVVGEARQESRRLLPPDGWGRRRCSLNDTGSWAECLPLLWSILG